jgi:cytochrome c-type protein NapB
MKGRLLMISIFVLLFIGTVVIFGTAINNNNSPTISKKEVKQEILLTQEGGVFTRSQLAEEYKVMPEGSRTMDGYYDNRAYLGAPPMITHPLISEIGIGGKACLQCHQNGGYVSQFEAFAPVTPHPEWLNCRQCHLPQTNGPLFKNTDWEKPIPPKLGNQALSTSPLVMPHGIQNRENCLSCHAGPAAPEEIRVTHPERINCRQCHVLNKNDDIFFTPVEMRNSSFIRSDLKETETDKMDEQKQKEVENWIDKKESN